ncbi:hypothetical protein BJX64DRAFT_265148 [Aspergillus heterothallicus]
MRSAPGWSRISFSTQLRCSRLCNPFRYLSHISGAFLILPLASTTFFTASHIVMTLAVTPRGSTIVLTRALLRYLCGAEM